MLAADWFQDFAFDDEDLRDEAAQQPSDRWRLTDGGELDAPATTTQADLVDGGVGDLYDPLAMTLMMSVLPLEASSSRADALHAALMQNVMEMDFDLDSMPPTDAEPSDAEDDVGSPIGRHADTADGPQLPPLLPTDGEGTSASTATFALPSFAPRRDTWQLAVAPPTPSVDHLAPDIRRPAAAPSALLVREQYRRLVHLEAGLPRMLLGRATGLNEQQSSDRAVAYLEAFYNAEEAFVKTVLQQHQKNQ